MSELPSQVPVVVVGGGVVGASVAWHLAGLGVSDVLLLERAKIGSGTTWHAAGNMETYRADPLIGDLVAYTLEVFPRLVEETGIEIGWRQTGRVHFTADPATFATYRSVPARSRARGVPIEVITPAEVVERLPFASAEGLIGGLWIPDDGRVDPTNLAMAYARGASRRGARVVEGQGVSRILVENGRVVGVETDQSRVRCDTVVLAAGLWSTALARTCGLRLPLVALHHFYILTKPLPGIGRDLPLFLSYDEMIYGREDVGGLLVGVFDPDAIPLEPEELPEGFVFSLLPENWDQIAPNLPILQRRFPVLERAEIRMLVNGPESFTPDGNMLLGEVPGVRGLFLCTGMNSNGIALAAGAGRLAAEWLVHGRPSLDATRLDLRRFMPFESGQRYRHRRMGEQFEVLCQAPRPDRDYRRTRGIRRSPLHTALASRGAVFVTRAGCEVPAWFGEPGMPWGEAVRAELAAAEHGIAVHDRSADAKLWVEGPDAPALLGRLTGLPAARLEPGAIAQAPMLDERSGVQALPWLLPLAAERFMLLAEPEDAVRLLSWLRGRLEPGERVAIVDVGPGWACLDLVGPAAAASCAEALPAGQDVRLEAEIGFAPCIIARLPMASAWRVLCTADLAEGLILALDEAGPAQVMGTLAADTLRVRAGLRRFGREASPTLDAVAAGLDAALAAAGRRFIGDEALAAGRRRPPASRIVPLRLDGVPGWAGDLTDEPILAGGGIGGIVGHVTSSAHVDRDGQVDLLGLLPDAIESPAVVLDGRVVPLARLA